ncbi:MAG: tRNA 2-thiouridine(34) synthase MnmA [Clostridia bacterium]|nr:tRNA 2-thiouridine(34) synthase MnmA [Clostridia bacterium]
MKILVGMSGGVDSTYAALALLRLGHSVEGAVLLMHDHTEIGAAKESAAGVGIPLHVIDCRERFENAVVKNFISEYLGGRTPNPCVVCNSDVKFRVLYEYAMERGFDMIATGHYAKITKITENSATRYAVSRSLDVKKDQTYMLWRLSQDILAKLCFPLAESSKSEVRKESYAASLSAADRKDSQEICFIPSGDYPDFIEERVGKLPHGRFLDSHGRDLGEHKGIIRYTVGQRKGLGVAAGQRIFVTDIDAENNNVILSTEDSYSDKVYVNGIRFSGISELDVGEKRALYVKLRYRAAPVPCIFEYLGDGGGVARMETPARAVTPGQSAVFYDGDTVALGGFIQRG